MFRPAFPDLSRDELAALCLRQNENVRGLLAALKGIIVKLDPPCPFDPKRNPNQYRAWFAVFDAARAAIAKAGG